MDAAVGELAAGRTGPAPVEGLVWAFAFDGEGRPEALADAAVADRLARHVGWLWLHFNLTDSRARAWIAAAPLGETALAVLLDPHPRPALVLDAEGAAAGVLADFHLEYDRGTTSELGHLRFAVTERLIVTARHHPLQAVQRTRDGLAGGRRLRGAAQLLDAVADGFLDAATEGVEAMGDELDAIEDALIAGRADAVQPRVGAIRRALLRLHREVVPLRAALRRAALADADLAQAPHRAALAASAARLAGRLDGLDHDVQALQDRARLLRDEMETVATAETNRQLYVLSVLTAVFLPGTLVTGLFGMNTKDLPFQQTDGGFWFSVAVLVLATALVLLCLRRARVIR